MTNQITQDVLLLSASTLVGDDVVNLQGEKIGKLEEIMLDINEGRIGYAVVSFGGVLGLGNKLFAVPWASLTVDTDKKQLVMDADVERLKKAPGFDKDNWPKVPNGQWVNDVYSFYNVKPYWS